MPCTALSPPAALLVRALPLTRLPHWFVGIIGRRRPLVKRLRALTQEGGACYTTPMFSSVPGIFSRRLWAFAFVFILCLSQSAGLAQGAPPPDGSSILLTFTGDCTLGGQEWLRNRDFSFVSHIKRHGYAYPFAQVREFFQEDDLTVINLENVFYDKTTTPAKKNYLFRAPEEFARILPEGSVELAFVANNHIMDYGQAGLNSTLKALEGQGVAWFGSNYQLADTYIYEKEGVRIGFIGSYQSYWYSRKEKFSQQLEALKQAGCSAIIGIIHDGTEYAPRRGKRQMSMARWLVNNGVNLVIGHHPHVPQGIDILDSATVLYSLGNFSFGGNKDLDISRRPGRRADKALVARVELFFDAAGAYAGQQVRLIPVSPSGTAEHNNYQPVILTGQDALDTLALVQADTDFTLPPYTEGFGALMDYLPAATSP